MLLMQECLNIHVLIKCVLEVLHMVGISGGNTAVGSMANQRDF